MGQVKENLLTKGFSGRIGDEIVFRQVKNRTLFAKRPRKSTIVSPNQVSQRELFGKAVVFAKTMLFDPDVRADYQNRAKMGGLASAYNAAVTDYLKDPKINSIDTDYYKGEVGDIIWVIALDNFKLQNMTVTLLRADDTVIESGDAVLEEGRWKYIVSQANDSAGTKVLVVASDRPGKEAQLEKVL